MQCTRQLLTPASSSPKPCARKMTKPRSIHNEDTKETRKSSESNSQIFIINADSVVSKRQPEVQSSAILEDGAMDLKFIDIHMAQWNSNLALQNSISEIRPELGPIPRNFNKPSISEGSTLLKTARSVKNDES